MKIKMNARRRRGTAQGPRIRESVSVHPCIRASVDSLKLLQNWLQPRSFDSLHARLCSIRSLCKSMSPRGPACAGHPGHRPRYRLRLAMLHHWKMACEVWGSIR